MVKTLDKFGGWLTFFYVGNWLGLIMGSIGLLIILVAFLGVKNINEMSAVVITFFDLVVFIFLMSKIIRIIKLQEQTVPDKVVKIMSLVVIFSFIFSVLDIAFNYLLSVGMNSAYVINTSREVIRNVIWFLIWRSYFKKSERVLKYYGKNTGM